MAKTLLGLTVCAQIFATVAFGQTDPANEPAKAGDTDGNYGQSWTSTLGSAIFSDTGMMTIRPASELTAQWNTLSETDRMMIRNDCKDYRSKVTASGGDTTSTATSGSGTQGSTTSSTDLTANVQSGTERTATVNNAQMKEICATIETLK